MKDFRKKRRNNFTNIPEINIKSKRTNTGS